MLNKKSFLYFLLLIVLFLFSELFLIPARLYFEFKWLDIIMHIVGGYLLGGLFYNIFIYKYKESNYKYLWLLFFVFIIGVLWEVSEYIRDIIAQREWSGMIDTIKDIFDDIIGVLLYLYRKINTDK